MLSIASKKLKVRPPLKWAGGKTQLINVLLSRVPESYNTYFEPFFGGGALFFALQPQMSIISDSNPELVNVYKQIAYNVEKLIELLDEHENSEEYYYRVRSINQNNLHEIEKASRTIFLNRTCYNGLYRVNRKGFFNVPYGKYKNPNICDAENLRAVSNLLQNTSINCDDYKKILYSNATEGDFIYLDPPYLPVSKYSDFKRYTKEQFYKEDHIELAKVVDDMYQMGCYVVLTNSNHPLVHELYSKYKVEVFSTRRNINSHGKKRVGEDVVITANPYRKSFLVNKNITLSSQLKKYPPTRFMGSKSKIIGNIISIAREFQYESVIDLFSGSGVVSYAFKTENKKVISNDYMSMNYHISTALIENNNNILPIEMAEELMSSNTTKNDFFVQNNFSGLYFKDYDNAIIDNIRANIKELNNKYEISIAKAALMRACLKKRPRGIFTYTGYKYDDGRKDLKVSLSEHFMEAVKTLNFAVFDNKNTNFAVNKNAMNFNFDADLVYMDPPYYSKHSDNEYVRRYHFLEGIACDWKDVEIQWETKTKKIRNYPTPFSSKVGAYSAFSDLFKKYTDSILLISYSSNSLPSLEEMIDLLAQSKKHVEVIELDYKYSFGNHKHKINNNNNSVSEYIFIGY